MFILPALDLASFVILSFILIATFFRRMTRGKVNQLFLIIVLECLLTCIFDIIAVYLDRRIEPRYETAQFIFHSLYVFLHNLTAPLYFLYIIAQTDTFHRFGKKKAAIYFAVLPCLFYAAVMIVNVFNGMVFTVNRCIYERGWFMNVLYAMVILWSVASIAYLLAYRRLFSKMALCGMISLFPMLGAAVIIQKINHDWRVEMFALTLGFLFVATFIQRPEALIDFNTGLNKFNAYVQDIKRNFSNKKEFQNIMINIANFLSIQEILSYENTNEVLRMTAGTISKIVKQSQTGASMYYLDKGRFRVVINRNASDKTDYIAETINAALKPKMPINGIEVNLIAYVCIARCPEDIGDFDTTIEFGKDLSKFSFSGKVLYASQMLDRSKYDLMSNLDMILNDAILNRKFEVYYQPIYSVEERCFRSAEALVRLYNDKYGFISPEIFIPVSEKSGAILKIGMFVFEEVCRFIASDEFRELGLDYIEVNLSVMQCMQGGLAGDLLSVMKKYGVTPEQINLEITESADSQTQSIIAENMNALLNAGLTFSLDDFGTGYSNMQRMASLPLKIVKLDKTFVNIDDNPKLMIVVQNTVKMLKALDMQIVVEGVETKELVDRFRLLQCEYIQGYFYSKPLPKNEFIAFIKKQNKEIPKHQPTS